jgi:PAS domain S-box-containing protein
MNWQHTPYTLPMLAATAISIGAVLRLSLRHRHSSGAGIATLLLLAGAVWMLGSALETAAADLPPKILWEKLQFVGICIIPPAWLTYVLHYTGHDKWPNLNFRIAISIVPGLTLLLVLTNEAHRLIWQDAWLDMSGRYAAMQVTYGPALWVFTAYAYALLLVGVLFLIRELVRSGRLYRWQATALLVAVMTPWLLNVWEHVFGRTAPANFQLTPMVLTVTMPVIAWSLYRLRARDIVPVAREAVIDGMDDGVVVLDVGSRIVDLNRAAQRLFGCVRSDLLGKKLDQFWPEYPGWTASSGGEGTLTQRMKPDEHGRQRTFSVRISPVSDWRGRQLRDRSARHHRTATANGRTGHRPGGDQGRVLFARSR